MPLSKRKFQAAGEVIVFMALLGISSFDSPAWLAQAEGSSAGQARTFKSISEEIDKLIREYYPKAKISVTDKGIHFEYKVKNGISAHSGRPAMVPAEGGILGDVTLKDGEYNGTDKAKLPSEETDGYNTILTMAPYSRDENAHLFAQLSFPSDVPVDFMSKFKDEIKAYKVDGVASLPVLPFAAQPGSQSNPQPSTPPQNVAPSPAAGAPIVKAPQAVAAVEWLPTRAAEAQLSFKIPSTHQEKIVKDQFQNGKFWIGDIEGCKFMVSYLKQKNQCITDADRNRVWNSMLVNILSQNSPKLVKQFVFQDVKAREYSISDPKGGRGKAVLCIAPNCHYIFLAAGPTPAISRQMPTFFDAVKIGK